MQNNLAPQTQSNNQIGFKAVAKYALLPGIIPMIRRLAERFGHLLHIFTIIFGAVGLIDRNHPCLRPENIGRYRFIDILGVAAHNVRFDRKHIPQVLMFFSVIASIVLMIAIVASCVLGILFHTAQANAQYFTNPTTGKLPAPPAQDWAYQFLRRVFGATGLSGLWDGTDTDNIFAVMFREMLKTYSMALMVIAVFMVIYIIVNVLVESARSGKPFGDKFDSIWAPIRLITAIGLLVPIGGGYNSAQLITFQVADWGSALATNVWVAGLDKFDTEGLISATDPDPNYRFIRAYFLIRLCQEGWNNFADVGGTDDKDKVQIWAVPGAIKTKKIMRYKFGTEENKTFCGEIELPQLTEEEINSIKSRQLLVNTKDHPAQYVQYLAYNIRNLHSVAFSKLRCSGIEKDIETIVDRFASKKDCSMEDISEINDPLAIRRWIIGDKNTGIEGYWAGLGYNGSRFFKQDAKPVNGTCTNNFKPNAIVKADLTEQFNNAGKELVATMQMGSQHGWAAAGSFYLQLAQNLGKLSEAVGVQPKATLMPRVMNYRLAVPTEPDTDTVTLTPTEITKACEENKYSASCQLYTMLDRADVWFKTAPSKDAAFAEQIDFDGRFAVQMRDTADTKAMVSAHNGSEIYTLAGLRGVQRIPDTTMNPLSSLVEMGNSFRTSGYILYTLAIVFSSSIFGSSALGSILQTFGSIYLMAGFTLSFVMPIMPFLNFAFGVLEWIMTVFEAVVGMPLWALAFVSREGGWIEGKPMEGIMLLFEMFLRPTILIFALIGALIMFAAGVKFFNEAFDMYLLTAPDEFDTGNMFNNLAYTVVYVFVMYSLGNSCFKLIGKMPDTFLRWYGKGANAFGGIMEAGAAEVNPYVVATYAKDLSNQGSAVGVAGVNVAHKDLNSANMKRDLNEERDNVKSAYNDAKDMRQRATEAQQIADADGATQEQKNAAQALSFKAGQADKKAEDAAQRFEAITGSEVDEEGNTTELSDEQYGKFQKYKAGSNNVTKNWDATRWINKGVDKLTGAQPGEGLGLTNTYDRSEEAIRQSVDPLTKANKKEAEKKRRENVEAAINNDEARRRGIDPKDPDPKP